MVNREVEAKIIEILVQTQFAHWVDKGQRETAVEIKNQHQEATEYFCGVFRKLISAEEHTKQTKFNALIRHQIGLIRESL